MNNSRLLVYKHDDPGDHLPPCAQLFGAPLMRYVLMLIFIPYQCSVFKYPSEWEVRGLSDFASIFPIYPHPPIPCNITRIPKKEMRPAIPSFSGLDSLYRLDSSVLSASFFKAQEFTASRCLAAARFESAMFDVRYLERYYFKSLRGHCICLSDQIGTNYLGFP